MTGYTSSTGSRVEIRQLRRDLRQDYSRLWSYHISFSTRVHMVAFGGLQRNHDLRCTMKRQLCVILGKRQFVFSLCQVMERCSGSSASVDQYGFQYGCAVHYIEVSYSGSIGPWSGIQNMYFCLCNLDLCALTPPFSTKFEPEGP